VCPTFVFAGEVDVVDIVVNVVVTSVLDVVDIAVVLVMVLVILVNVLVAATPMPGGFPGWLKRWTPSKLRMSSKAEGVMM